jgi:hypothetical protein
VSGGEKRGAGGGLIREGGVSFSEASQSLRDLLK